MPMSSVGTAMWVVGFVMVNAAIGFHFGGWVLAVGLVGGLLAIVGGLFDRFGED